jgi:hypothetical protein
MNQEPKEFPAPVPKAGVSNEKKRTSKGILCPKCSHLNKPGSTKCARCESHLHIKCNDCGVTNERVHSRCQECGRRLHKSMIEKMNARLFSRGAKIAPWQFILVGIVVAVLLLCMYVFNQLTFTPR